MITNATEFPCIEATRCLITEKEMGKRLTVKTISHNENTHVVAFTKDQSPKQEWYLHLDFEQCQEEGLTAVRRILQLRHGETGQYLSCDDYGRVSCIPTPADTTYWLMQAVDINPPNSGEKKRLSPRSSSDPAVATDGSADDQYILVSKKNPSRKLTYTANLNGANGSEEELQVIASKNDYSDGTVWTFKFNSGELCFISNPVVHCQLRCNLLGQLSLTSKSDGWEVFRFIEVGNGDLYISSWTHYTKFLSSDSDGQVYATDLSSTALGYAQRWRLEPSPGANGVYIKNVANHRYLSLGRERAEAIWTTTKPNDYALWHLDAAHSCIYYLTSLFASTEKTVEEKEKHFDDEEAGADAEDSRVESKTTAANAYNQIFSKEGVADMHVSSCKEGPFLTKKKQKGEEWKVELTDDGDVTFFSMAHEKYLGCNSKGDVHTTTSKGSWTLWEKRVSAYGGVTFLSREHLRFLAVNEEDGSLCTTPGDEDTNLTHSWRMDPRLPRSVSGGKIAGAFGLSVTIAMPFAVLGAIEAAGAAVTELAMLGMSAEAMAGVGAGAAIGAAMLGTAAALVPNDSKENKRNLSEDGEVLNEFFQNAQRPISAWKSWVKIPKMPPPQAFFDGTATESSD